MKKIFTISLFGTAVLFLTILCCLFFTSSHEIIAKKTLPLQEQVSKAPSYTVAENLPILMTGQKNDFERKKPIKQVIEYDNEMIRSLKNLFTLFCCFPPSSFASRARRMKEIIRGEIVDSA